MNEMNFYYTISTIFSIELLLLLSHSHSIRRNVFIFLLFLNLFFLQVYRFYVYWRLCCITTSRLVLTLFKNIARLLLLLLLLLLVSLLNFLLASVVVLYDRAWVWSTAWCRYSVYEPYFVIRGVSVSFCIHELAHMLYAIYVCATFTRTILTMNPQHVLIH